MRNWLDKAGFDPRFTSLVLALAIIWGALAIATDGIFLTPRNLYNLSIQTCVTAIMSCGMVYLIVARQIDLSVGSLMAFTGMVIAFTQKRRGVGSSRSRSAWRREWCSAHSRAGGPPIASCPRFS
jgi:D-xylose transport system permease protein